MTTSSFPLGARLVPSLIGCSDGTHRTQAPTVKRHTNEHAWLGRGHQLCQSLLSLVPDPFREFEVNKTKDIRAAAERMRESMERRDSLKFLTIYTAVLTLWGLYYALNSTNYVPLFANVLICALNMLAALVYMLTFRWGLCRWFQPHAVMAIVVVGHAALIALHEGTVQVYCYTNFSFWRLLRDAPALASEISSDDALEWLTAHNFFISHSYFILFVLPVRYAAASCLPCLFTYAFIVQACGGPTAGFYTSALVVYSSVLARWQSTRCQRKLFLVIESQRRALSSQASMTEALPSMRVEGPEQASLSSDAAGKTASASLESQASVDNFPSDFFGSLRACASSSKDNLEDAEHLQTIQFSTEVYYCAEDDGYIDVVVNRLGQLGQDLGPAAVCYETKDRSAVAGEKYAARKGVLRFDHGEREHAIRIQILQDDKFDTSSEFEVVLFEPKHATLGLHLRTARIIIVDDDAFPTNKFREELLTQKYYEVNHWSLMIEFVLNCLSDANFRRQALKNLISDQISNFRWIYSIRLATYLLDDVLNPAPPKTVPRHANMIVIIIVLMSFLPPLFELLLEYCKGRRRVRGMVLARLQSNLLRRFLQYDNASRNAVSISDILMAITRDVPVLIDEGLLPMFKIVKHCGLFVLLSCLAINFLFRTTYVFSILLFVGVPTIMAGFIRFRRKGSAKRRIDVFQAQTNMVGFIQESTACYRLITDYGQTSAVVDSFGHKVKAANATFTSSALWETTNLHVAPILTVLLSGAFVLLTFRQVVAQSIDVVQGEIGDGSQDSDVRLSIGEFCAGLALCSTLGGCLQQIYVNLLRIQSAMAPLNNIVSYMNMPVDTGLRMDIQRRTCAWSSEQQDVVSSKHSEHLASDTTDAKRLATRLRKSRSHIEATEVPVLAVDLLPICGVNISFSYAQSVDQGMKILSSACFKIQQGHLTVVTGDHRCGKSTFLHVLAGVQVPTWQRDVGGSNGLFIPPHLRVLHVSAEPVIFASMNLLDNLCFGQSDAVDREVHRVLAVCKRLGISTHATRQLKRDIRKSHGIALSLEEELDELGEYDVDGVSCVGTSISVAQRRITAAKAIQAQRLSRTDQCLLHIARALIMNPEVLVMHKPLVHFDELLKHNILEIFREFTDLRGVECQPQDFSKRRPRTCIFSSPSTKYTENVDMVLNISKGKVETIDHTSLDFLNRSIRQLFDALDRNADGLVSREEFVDAVSTKPWLADLFQLETHLVDAAAYLKAAEVFDLMDHEDQGALGLNELEGYIRGLVDANLMIVLDSLKNFSESSLLHEEESPLLNEEQVPSESPLPETMAWASAQTEALLEALLVRPASAPLSACHPHGSPSDGGLSLSLSQHKLLET